MGRVPFTSLAQVGPFIFLGVGVDDVIVLLDSFRSARVTLRDGGDVRSRAEFAAERAGVSIAITSATNFLAFALGSRTVIPAVHWFCVYAAAAILADFIAQMSLFLAIVLIHETRDQAAGSPARTPQPREKVLLPRPPTKPRRARFETWRLTRALAETTTTTPETTTTRRRRRRHRRRRRDDTGEDDDDTGEDDDDTEKTTTPVDTPEKEKKGSGALCGRWDASAAFDDWVRRYADFLMRPGVRVAVVLAFCGYAAFALARVRDVEEGLPRTALAPDDSFLQGYFDILDETFEAQVGAEMQHHVQGVDLASPETQALVLAAWATYLSIPTPRPWERRRGKTARAPPPIGSPPCSRRATRRRSRRRAAL